MNQIQPCQHDRWMELAGWSVLFLRETGSTNDDCHRLAEEITGEFVVWAGHQKAGRGREERTWFDQPGSALTFSVLLRLKPEETACLGRFTALGALSIIDLLKTDFDLDAKIKWPNDVLIRDKKVCGILAELAWQGFLPQSLVLGIGINLTNRAFASAGELRTPATSLKAEGAPLTDPESFLEKLLEAIQRRRKTLGSDQFMHDWNANLAYKGQFVPFKQYQGKTGVFCPEYVNPDGSLTVSDQQGERFSLYSSEISGSSSET